MKPIELNCKFSLEISFNFPREKFENASEEEIALDIRDMAEGIKKLISEDFAISEYGTVDIKLISHSVKK